MKQLLNFLFLLVHISLFSQSFTSYFTGNTTNITTTPQGGVCMMGGASEHDEAMKWFLERANTGDVLVLRASGSDGYNDYMYNELGVAINSVETIVFHNSDAANESYIHDKIMNAEAIWFAGGDQWDYISYWRNTSVSPLINDAIQNRNIVIGGTSAGMAILGSYYFSASNGTVTSSTALNNPYDSRITVQSDSFLEVDYLQDIITDTHYDDPDRKGRHIVFLARILTDDGVAAKGIACNEYTAVCVDENGLARVYGDYPNFPETAFFLQTNCEISEFAPENCTPSTPLNWNLNGTAIRVYKVHGTNNGANTFDLSDWETGNGGTWENWYVDSGTLNQTPGDQIDCSTLSLENYNTALATIYPNPFEDVFFVESTNEILELTLVDVNGKVLLSQNEFQSSKVTLKKTGLLKGVYFIKLYTTKGFSNYKLLKE